MANRRFQDKGREILTSIWTCQSEVCLPKYIDLAERRAGKLKCSREARVRDIIFRTICIDWAIKSMRLAITEVLGQDHFVTEISKIVLWNIWICYNYFTQNTVRLVVSSQECGISEVAIPSWQQAKSQTEKAASLRSVREGRPQGKLPMQKLEGQIGGYRESQLPEQKSRSGKHTETTTDKLLELQCRPVRREQNSRWASLPRTLRFCEFCLQRSGPSLRTFLSCF